MSLLITTQAEFLELVEELRGMATAAPTAKIRNELTRIADRYAARAADAGRVRSTDITGAAACAAVRNRPGERDYSKLTAPRTWAQAGSR
jgi:hypothetical protein